MPERGRDLILAGAILSIMLNPVLFAMLDRIMAKSDASGVEGRGQRGRRPPGAGAETELTGHVVLVGHGRVGSIISEELGEAAPRCW